MTTFKFNERFSDAGSMYMVQCVCVSDNGKESENIQSARCPYINEKPPKEELDKMYADAFLYASGIKTE